MMLWLGAELGCVSAIEPLRVLDRPPVQTPSRTTFLHELPPPLRRDWLLADLSPDERRALVHLGGYVGALRADRPSLAGPDPDLQTAQAYSLRPGRSLEDLLRRVQRHLAEQADSFYALVFALQERGTLEAADVRRLVLRARLRRRR
jgi:hypothetical protein